MSPLVTLVLIARSASGAIFLILEMYSPFNGMMQLDSEPLRRADPRWSTSAMSANLSAGGGRQRSNV